MYKILVVEDEDALREELIERLQFEGYDASGAPDGEVAAASIALALPDLILCDVNMPFRDGFGVLKTVRHEMNQTTPVIFLSATGDQTLVDRAFREGVDGYVIKPFRFSDLLDQIKQHLAS